MAEKKRDIERNDSGYYCGQWDGKEIRYPSVTTALGILTDFSRVQPDILKRACDFGNAVHRLVHFYEAGTLDVDSLDSALRPLLDAWIRRKTENGIIVHASEIAVVSTKYRYAGRLDVIADVKGTRGVIELKSRPYNPLADSLQTDAYKQAYNESYPKDRARKRYFCSLGAEEGDTFFEIKDTPGQPEHLAVFLSALALYKWRELKK